MKRVARFAAILGVVPLGVALTPRYAESSSAATLRTLHCSDSAGQQGRGGETVVGGVEGLVLPGSGDPSLLRSLRGVDGQRYYVYKAFLAVSQDVAPYATVTVVSPRSATLYYGRSSVVGALASRVHGRGLIAAATTQIRFPVCGSNFTGYVGGIIVRKPTSVTFAVSSPRHKTVRVTVGIGNH